MASGPFHPHDGTWVVVALPHLPSSEDRKEVEAVDCPCWEEGAHQQASAEVEAQPPFHREEVAD